MDVWDIITAVLVLIGALFSIIGGIGMLRMPDFYSRCHASAVSDTAGAAFVLFGLTFQSGVLTLHGFLITMKLVMVLVFLWLTGPAATHALAKAAYSGGLKAK